MTRLPRYLLTVVVCTALGACAKKPLPELPTNMLPQPLPADVESVIFLVGDVGAAIWERSPLPRRLARDVDWWARALGRDSSVAVVFLGDNIYPTGLHDAGDPEWAQDSTHLEAQARILAGPNARANKAFGVFVAGNHDWGNLTGEAGVRRLRNEEEFLARRQAQGIHVGLMPEAGVPGPGIVDVGRGIRLFLIDTAWWLLSADAEEKQRTMQRLEQGIAQTRDRDVVIAAHHPLRSASAHGGLMSFFKAFGVRWLLHKSGAALQDLNSLPYREFLNMLNEVFVKVGPPMLFAGGHDHALQVLRAVKKEEPAYMVVSGAGSKLSKVGHTDGMLYRSREPGYMALIVRKNRSVDLHVYTAPEGFLMCYPAPADVQEQCVEAGAAEFSPKFGVRLK